MIAQKLLEHRRSLELIHGDLTRSGVDAIVNAANSHLLHGGGVAGAIVRRGGREIQRESNRWVKEHGPVTHDEPAITTAGRLSCRYVIHAVGPKWGEGEEDEKLQRAVYGALALADRKELMSIALPAISTGIFGFPKLRAARLILDAILDFFDEHPGSSVRKVQLILIDEPSVRVFADEFENRWSQSVDIG
jgi:O-acetyl-ADP-ribose deacetylase (regulator of RNase III)